MKFLMSLIVLLVLGLNVSSASAQSISINVSNSQYDGIPALEGISVYSDFQDRTAAVSAVASRYRSITGGLASNLKPGVVFKIIYKNGTSENAIAASPLSVFQAAPVPGSQKDANGNPIGGSGGSSGGGDSGGGGYNIGIIGYNPIYGQYTYTDANGVLQVVSVIIGYEPVYGYTQNRTF
ncbi:MAG: hypothetical protein ACREO1_08680 [Arenimonas sp.]